jgi:predicted DNA-binding transcriptional regulator AlpA
MKDTDRTISPKTLSIVRAFDQLPETALISGSVVDALCGFTPASRYRHMAANSFPLPVKLGGASKWVAGEVRQWLQDRIAGVRGPLMHGVSA